MLRPLGGGSWGVEMEHTTDLRRPPSGTAPAGTSPPSHLVVLPWGEPDGYVERLLRTQRSPSRSAWRQTSEACRSRSLAARRRPERGPATGLTAAPRTGKRARLTAT